MFTSLRLKNFKAWKDTKNIALKPITVLLGTNSSGKSSLIQSLLLLKQTVQSPDRTIHLNLGGDEVNDLFNFGGFDDVVNQSATAPLQFSIGFDFTRNAGADGGSFDCVYGKTSTGSVAIQDLSLKTGARKFRAARNGKGAFSISVDAEPAPRFIGRQHAPERSIALSAGTIAALDTDGQVVEDLSLALRRELEGIIYLGPLRRKPERDYLWNKTNPGVLGSDGAGAINALLFSALVRNEEQRSILNGVSHWLVEMKVADRVELRRQGRSSRYELIIHRGNLASNLRDVGIGVSQVLPVLVAAYFAPKGSTVILEEPEIHLHPLAQSVLAELFVKVSREREVQFVIETHSEHLFRRMQTLMARGDVQKDQVAMYFVEHVKRTRAAKLIPLEFDDFGRALNWPDGFFGDALGETREQARQMIERQRKAAAR